MNNLNTALKEWSATIDALVGGDQIFLLRKGGIRETNRHFELMHQRFLLYPTRFHEAEKLLKPAFQYLLDTNVDADSEIVHIRAWAEVADVISIDNAATLESLSEHHIWTHEFVSKRIAWKPRHAADLIVLKTHYFTDPLPITVEPHHKGCKSWVDIEPSINISASLPAIPDSVWDRRVQEIRRSLTERSIQTVPAL